MDSRELQIYVLSEDGQSFVPMLIGGEPVSLVSWTYTSQRMGTAVVTAELRTWECLDDVWTGREFVCVDETGTAGVGTVWMEKFFLQGLPGSRKDSDDARYVHSLEFASERDVTLGSVYFCDAVDPEGATHDRYMSNNYDVTFFGTLFEFVSRFNDVLAYRGLAERFRVKLESDTFRTEDGVYAFLSEGQGFYKWATAGNVYRYTDSRIIWPGMPTWTNSKLNRGRKEVIDWEERGETEAKEVSFSKKTLFEVLQEAYGVWKIPFYFLGDTAVFGGGDVEVPETVFSYGPEDELLSIAREDAGAKVVTYCTAEGGSTNVPFYYPNPTPKGFLRPGGTAGASFIGEEGTERYWRSMLLFSERFALSSEYVYRGPAQVPTLTFMQGEQALNSWRCEGLACGGRRQLNLHLSIHVPEDVRVSHIDCLFYGGGVTVYGGQGGNRPAGTMYLQPLAVSGFHECFAGLDDVSEGGSWNSRHDVSGGDEGQQDGSGSGRPSERRKDYAGRYFYRTEPITREVTWNDVHATGLIGQYETVSRTEDLPVGFRFFPVGVLEAGDYDVSCIVEARVAFWDETSPNGASHIPAEASADFGFQSLFDGSFGPCWRDQDGNRIYDLSEVGLVCPSPVSGQTITQEVVRRINTSPVLLPSVYRETFGSHRFYPAVNEATEIRDHVFGPYDDYRFANVYEPLAPREHIADQMDDIYPTIKGMTYRGREIARLDDVAFDAGFNIHDVQPDGVTRKYSWFYVRLRPLGFNLFDCAMYDGEMTLDVTSGPCAGCSFKVLGKDSGTGLYTNGVQVDSDGLLVRDAEGRVVIDYSSPVARQQDTTENSVWIAVQLDDSTFGGDDVEYGVMPDWNEVQGAGIRPQQGDTFVITNILLPQSYILAAEKRLEDAIIEFMWLNNTEKSRFSVRFSRVWLAEHPDVRDSLSAHAALRLSYDGKVLEEPLHVTEYTVKVEEGVPLPEISVTLDEIVDVPRSGLDRRIAANLGETLVIEGGQGGADLRETDSRYVRKDVDDEVKGVLKFMRGFQIGDFRSGATGTGASAHVDDAGRTHLEVDRLLVREKAVFTQTEVDQLRSVGGEIVVSLANGTVRSVQGTPEGGYVCYLVTDTASDAAVKHSFAVDDLVICRRYNATSASSWWRRVVGIGMDYIILGGAASDRLEGSDEPTQGDVVVQLGNASDRSRQAAQILSCYGEQSPSHVMYAGIDSFSLVGKDIYGVVYEAGEVDGQTVWEPRFYNYGSMLLGTRDRNGDYIEYDNRTRKLNIRADVKIMGGTKTIEEALGDLDYLKQALGDDTEISGGLILTSLIQLGQRLDEGYRNWAGISGLYDPEKPGGGIAAWYGGEMLDLENLREGDDPSKAAQSLFRMDGTGYLAGGLISWSVKDGVADLVINGGSVIGGTGVTLEQVAGFKDLFEIVEIGGGRHAAKLKDSFGGIVLDGLYTDGFLAAGGKSGQQGGGGGGASTLAELLDMAPDVATATNGQLLAKGNDNKWHAIDQSTIVPDLSGYMRTIDVKTLTVKQNGAPIGFYDPAAEDVTIDIPAQKNNGDCKVIFGRHVPAHDFRKNTMYIFPHTRIRIRLKTDNLPGYNPNLAYDIEELNIPFDPELVKFLPQSIWLWQTIDGMTDDYGPYVWRYSEESKTINIQSNLSAEYPTFVEIGIDGLGLKKDKDGNVSQVRYADGPTASPFFVIKNKIPVCVAPPSGIMKDNRRTTILSLDYRDVKVRRILKVFRHIKNNNGVVRKWVVTKNSSYKPIRKYRVYGYARRKRSVIFIEI